jgi:hypothetical protein
MRIGPCCEKQHRLWELIDFVIVKVGDDNRLGEKKNRMGG